MSSPDDSPNEHHLVVYTTPDPAHKPDLGVVRGVLLRDSQRVRKEARYLTVTDRHTGEYHHDALTVVTTKKLKAGDKEDPKHSVTLTTEGGVDEIGALDDFIRVVRTGALPVKSSKYVVLPAGGGGAVSRLADLVQSAGSAEKAAVLADVLTRAMTDRQVFDAVLDRASKDPELFTHAAAALNLAAYRQAVSELETLIAAPGVKEHAFQTLLAKNPWMFGSEYSEVLDRRRWTRDEQQDFVVRMTADRYIELVEIKTPLDGAPLFQHDRSHDSYYAGADQG